MLRYVVKFSPLWSARHTSSAHLLRDVGICKAHAHRRQYSSPSPTTETPSNLLPQAVDLLQIYHGLVTLGKITFDEDQIRVVMQVRKLCKYGIHLSHEAKWTSPYVYS